MIKQRNNDFRKRNEVAFVFQQNDEKHTHNEYKIEKVPYDSQNRKNDIMNKINNQKVSMISANTNTMMKRIKK